MAFSTLTVDLNASIAKFESDLKQAVETSKKSSESITHAFGAVKTGLALLGVGLGIHELVSQFNEITSSVLKLGQASEKTGIAVESLSGLKFAAESVQLPFDQLVLGLERFDKALDVTNPALQRLGFSLKQIQDLAKNPAAALGTIADKFAGMQDGAGKAAIAIQLFGKAGADLIPFLNLGSKGFADFQDKLQQLGGVTTAETVIAVKKLDDELLLLNKAVEISKTKIGLELVPALTQVVAEFNKAAQAGSLFSGVIHGLAQLGKVTLFGADKDAIGQQIELIQTLRNEQELLQGVQKIPNRSAEDQQITANRLAALKISLQETEAVLRRLQGLEKAKPDLTAAPDPLKDVSGTNAIIKAQLAAALALEKESASEKQTVLDAAHAQGLISEESFYASRTAIAQKELGANLKSIQQAIKEEQAALASADPAQAQQIQAKLIALNGQRAVIQKQIAFIGVKANIDETASLKALDDATAQYNIDLLISQGRTEEAVIAQQSLNKALEERQKLVSNRGEGSEAVRDLDAKRAQERSQARLNDLAAQANAIRDEELAKEADIQAVLELSGHTVEAELHAIDATNAARKEAITLLTASLAAQEAIAEAQGKTDVVAAIHRQIQELNLQAAALDPLVVSTRRYAAAQVEVSNITRESAIIEQHLLNLRENGSIVTLQLLADTDEARKQEVRRLTEVRDKLAEIAKTPEDLLKVKELTSQIETLAASANQLGHVFEDVFESSATNAISDFIDHTKSAEDAFKSFAKSVLEGLNHIASQAIAQQLFGGSTGSGGFLSVLGGLFAGSASGGGAGGGFSGRMAEGGITTGRTLAGESGPEAVIPLSGGRTVPVTLKSAAAPVNVYMTVVTPDANSFRQSNLQITNQLSAQLQRARQRA